MVNDSISWITRELNLSPLLSYTGGNKGWIGDNPFIFLETKKIQSLGWQPKLSIEQGVVRTAKFLNENPWVFSARV